MTSVKLLISAAAVALVMQAPAIAAEQTFDQYDVSIHDVLKQDLVGQVQQFNQQFTQSITSVARQQLELGKQDFESAMLDELAENDHVLAERAEKGDKPLAP
ncbi:hypothetical protein FM042_11245 [Aliidiomarina halalkaliphila]|uniref:Peptidylprolyl isomerase n=1 Tax=Aliidiomarina halalkaliphila TaxID=2593535 RepID=A0A552WYY5_9GAMM|nr:hypothetical protein [Aliidiomarina halalkaliphila]TRW47905.1 hypothetical protein FM042_11245 [Aliidiomarina halalkaliphila]